MRAEEEGLEGARAAGNTAGEEHVHTACNADEEAADEGFEGSEGGHRARGRLPIAMHIGDRIGFEEGGLRARYVGFQSRRVSGFCLGFWKRLLYLESLKASQFKPTRSPPAPSGQWTPQLRNHPTLSLSSPSMHGCSDSAVVHGWYCHFKVAVRLSAK